MMLKRKLLLGAMLASSIYVVPQSALAQVEIYVDRSPPPVRVERVPAHRAGYTWAPGYWDYRGNRHVWIKGHWVRERPGYVYYAPRWVQRDGRWYFERSRWDRGGSGDRDRDGIPNRVDRDRDGDGVPNRHDSNPNNPRRN